MKLFLVERIDESEHCKYFAMFILAEDAARAEEMARLKSDYFNTAKLSVKQLPLNKEFIALVANEGV